MKSTQSAARPCLQARIGAGTGALLGAAVLFACAGDGNHRAGSADAGGVDGASGGPAGDAGMVGASSSFTAATAAQLESVCRAACEGAMPDDRDTCDVSALDCTRDCQEELAFADDACLRCAAGKIVWRGGGCNDFECICDGPWFPDVHESACDGACVATIEHERAIELALPAPASVGHLPLATRILRELGRGEISIVAVGERVALCADQDSRLLQLDAELQTRAELDLTAERGCQLAPGVGGQLLTATGARATGLPVISLRAVDASSSELWQVALPISANVNPTGARAVALTPAGEAAVLSGDDRRLLLVAAAGTALTSGELDLAYDSFSPLDMAVQSDGTFVVLAHYAGSARSLLVGVRASPEADGSLAIEERFNHSFESEGAPLLRSIAVTGTDELLVSGELVEPIATGGMQRRPFVAKLSAAGEPLWRWSPDGGETGIAYDIAAGADGSSYAAGVEAPPPSAGAAASAAEPACAPEGCSVPTLRKFDRDGALVWSYLHREAGSTGVRLALGADGRVYVGALLRGTERNGIEGRPRAPLVLVFEP